MRRITFTRIATVKGGRYSSYADSLIQKFGGKSVELTTELADWCAAQGWCQAGGAEVLFAGDDEAFMRWIKADDRVYDRAAQQHPDNVDARWKIRWRALFRFANRNHAAKQRAKELKKAA